MGYKLGRWIQCNGRMIRRSLILDALIFAISFSFAAHICMLSAGYHQGFAGVVFGAHGPIVGAEVDASGAAGSGSAVTDSSGQFKISEGLGTGTYSLTVLALGYLKGETDNVNVTVGQITAGIAFDLQLSGGISGTVTDAVDGKPLSGIKVVTSWNQFAGTYGYATTTDSNGKYLLATDLPNGSYVVTALRPSGYITQSSSTQEVREGVETKNVNFQLVHSGIISGAVRASPGGGPLPGAFVGAFPYGAGDSLPPLGSTTTDANGRFSITTGLDTGQYDLVASVSGWPGFSRIIGVPVVAGLESSADLQIQVNGISWAIITGYVTDNNSGIPIVGANITAARSLGSSTSVVTDRNGNFRIDVPRTDAYNLTVTAPGYQDLTVEGINATINTLPTNVNLRMARVQASQSGQIAGMVTGASNLIPEFENPIIIALSLTLVATGTSRLLLKKKGF